jgi:DNA-nicking Smr family endonuclease
MSARKPPPHRPLRALRSRVLHPGTAPPPPKSTDGKAPTFAEAAAASGVVAWTDAPRRVPAPRPPAVAPPRRPPIEFTLEQHEDWLEGYRSALGVRTLSRVRGAPQGKLDLHGADTTSAKRQLAAFLAAERARRAALVLVVVGRGRHSPGGEGVLRREIAIWLSSGPTAAHVLAFRTAPPELGGSGGVLVLLAPTKR